MISSFWFVKLPSEVSTVMILIKSYSNRGRKTLIAHTLKMNKYRKKVIDARINKSRFLHFYDVETRQKVEGFRLRWVTWRTCFWNINRLSQLHRCFCSFLNAFKLLWQLHCPRDSTAHMISCSQLHTVSRASFQVFQS